jgi:hypothetical protein
VAWLLLQGFTRACFLWLELALDFRGAEDFLLASVLSFVVGFSLRFLLCQPAHFFGSTFGFLNFER